MLLHTIINEHDIFAKLDYLQNSKASKKCSPKSKNNHYIKIITEPKCFLKRKLISPHFCNKITPVPLD